MRMYNEKRQENTPDRINYCRYNIHKYLYDLPIHICSGWKNHTHRRHLHKCRLTYFNAFNHTQAFL